MKKPPFTLEDDALLGGSWSTLYPFPFVFALLVSVLAPGSAAAAIHYVDASSTNGMPPYTNWATAARVIQDAVDIATAGEEIVVSNGWYATGGRAVGTNLLVNRVAVDKPLTLHSVNGPGFTTIQGCQVPVTTNGSGAVRCVYLSNGAVLGGFTLTNGATQSSGHYQCNQSGGGVWCEGLGGVVSNCVLTGNSAYWNGGGARSGTLNRCVLAGNSADSGGGACSAMLNDCALSGNTAWSYGGGVCVSTLNNSILTGNSARYGGGASSWGTLNNCLVTGNSTDYDGGGAFIATLNNCTLTHNSALNRGGGASESTLNNCIVYYNSALDGANYSSSTLNYCCAEPLPPGAGNLHQEPQLASASHLSPGSPCRSAGSAAYVTGQDIDGEDWANPPSIGCDEYWSGAVTGALSVVILAAHTSVAIGYELEFQVVVGGRVSGLRWTFGDGHVVSNRPWASHAWSAAGDYDVELRAYNESFPGGVTATLAVHVVQEEHYVSLDSTNPVPPYDSWATAATNIQDAVDAAIVPGALVLVNNGVYATGGRVVGTNLLVNRVAVDKLLVLRSVNGPGFTRIEGHQVPPGSTNSASAVRCVYLTKGATLSGFTLTNGGTLRLEWSGGEGNLQDGGGILCESQSAFVTNCVLVGNCARDWGGGVYSGTLAHCILTGNTANAGGGAYNSALRDCTLVDNSALSWGGGAFLSWLESCTLIGNSADVGGGVLGCRLNKCALSGNSANSGGGAASFYATCILNNCTITDNRAQSGGGAFSAILSNCALFGNYATDQGGGCCSGELNKCTLIGNSSRVGGGVYGGSLTNCIVYYNDAPCAPNYAQGSLSCEDQWVEAYLSFCCTTPLPDEDWGGLRNITNGPLFINLAGGNLRLQSNSPCINAGNNLSVSGVTDLDGNPRIVSGTVDIGAYEYQGPGSVISYAWLQQFGLPTDGSVDNSDLDGDGHTTWQEWRCQTNPTNALSALRLVSASANGTDVALTWESVASVNYFVECCTNIAFPFTLLGTNIIGQPASTKFIHDIPAGTPALFYRIGVVP